jgi:hypothetical protein
MKRLLLVSALTVVFSLSTSMASGQIAIRAVGGDGAPIQLLGDSSQFMRYGSSRSSSPLTMLRQPQYQKELDLSDEQATEIQAVQKDIQRQTTEMFRKSAELGGDGGQLLAAAQSALREKADMAIKEILLPHQITRMNQIRVQAQIRARGASGLLDDDLFASLRLTDAQKTELAEKQREAQKELQEQIRKLTERSRTAVLKSVLKTEQLEKLEKLSGDEYQVERQTFRSFGVPGATILPAPAPAPSK